MSKSISQRKYVFFDIDGTLIRGQSQWILACFLYRRGIFNIYHLIVLNLWLLTYKLGFNKKTREIREFCFEPLKGIHHKDLIQLLENFWITELQHRIYKDAVNELNKYKKDNCTIYIISACILPLAEIIASKIVVHGCIATALEWDKEDKFTGHIKGEVIEGVIKATTIKSICGNEVSTTWAYSDHISDLPLLKTVAYPHIVNPDRKLKKIAVSNHWPIHSFLK